ncbi:MAG: hypothetical protein WC372_09680 [Candidatus Neomarinimicrobiota bacterium]|jgi:hypothetical protein
MRQKPFLPQLFLALFLLFTLSGCIEYREEIWLEKDGSGSLLFEIGLPEYASISDEDLSELSIVELCDSVEGITVTGSATYQVDKITWIQVFADFEHILLLNQVEDSWFGEIRLEEEDGAVRYSRLITMSDTLDNNGEGFGNMLKHALLGQYNWSYTLHLPDKILDCNTPLMFRDTLNNNLRWEYTLASLINEQKSMTVSFRRESGFKSFLRSIFKR